MRGDHWEEFESFGLRFPTKTAKFSTKNTGNPYLVKTAALLWPCCITELLLVRDQKKGHVAMTLLFLCEWLPDNLKDTQ